MSLISTLDVALRGDTTGLDNALSKSQREVASFSSNLSKIKPPQIGGGKGIGGLLNLGGAGGSMLALAGPWGALAAVAKEAAGAVKDFVAESLQGIDHLARMSSQLGTTTGNLAGLEHMATASGLSTEQLGEGLTHLQKNLSEAAQGGGEASVALAQLGIDAGKLQGQTFSQQVETIADGFKGLNNAADRTRLSMQLFGRGGAALGTMMAQGKEGIAKAREEAERLGLAVSGPQAEAVKQAGISWNLFKESIVGIGRSIAVGLTPLLSGAASLLASFGGWLAGAVKDALPWWEAISDTVSAFFKMVGEILAPVGEAIASWFEGWGGTWESFKKALLTGLFVLQFAFQNWRDAFGVVMDYVKLRLAQFGNDLVHLFTEVIPRLLAGESLGEAMKRPMTALERELQDRLTAAGNRVGADLVKFVDKKMAEFGQVKKDIEQAAGDTFTPSDKKPKAVEMGSAEAFSILNKTQGDKMYGVANQQLEKLKELIEVVRGLRKPKGDGLAVADM